MKSRLTIELDFDTSEPYIRVINDLKSDDVRDKLISHFREKLGHSSSWAKIEFFYKPEVNPEYIAFSIKPITTTMMDSEALIMLEQIRLNKEEGIYGTPVYSEGDSKGDKIRRVINALKHEGTSESGQTDSETIK